jgi:putative hydrolase of the HAD superfamily
LASFGGAQAIVFDLGGVLVDVDFRRAMRHWAAAAGVAMESIAGRFERDDAYCAHETGELSDGAYFRHLRTTLGLSISDEAMLAGWNAVLGEPLPGIEALVGRLAGEIPLYVFSNTNPAHLAHFKPRYERLLGHFRETFTSCELGARKPEAEAFRRLAARVAIHPARIIFFDDLEENVEGARRAGLQAFRVTRAQEIEAILDQKRSAR